MSQLIPSDEYLNGFAALEAAIKDARSISAAVAFVSEPGVQHLARLLDQRAETDVEIVARAAGVTTPEALLTLRDELGVEVSVVIGRHASAFHPKLWLIRSADRLSVLSGSGNLTDGGLVTNNEQFELSHTPLDSEAALNQEARFERLTTNAFRLDEIENTTIWSEWLTVIKQQRRHWLELQRLETQLASREVVTSREGDKRMLLDDLIELYEVTVAARLETKEGRRYVPTRFKQGIERARDRGDPVRMVYRICRHQTGGFDVILGADRPDLTVEALVVDETKPYHDLFTDETRRLSAERLRQFPSWP
jgi:HKD family nuclease